MPACAGVSTKHESKKRRKGGSGDDAALTGGGDLFSGDGLGQTQRDGDRGGGSRGGGRGGSRGGSSRGGGKTGGLSRTELNRVKRGGKGKSSFKSKKKFKRRK